MPVLHPRYVASLILGTLISSPTCILACGCEVINSLFYYLVFVHIRTRLIPLRVCVYVYVYVYAYVYVYVCVRVYVYVYVYASVPFDFFPLWLKITDRRKSMKIAVSKAGTIKKFSLGTKADCLETAWVCICHVLVVYLVLFIGELFP